MGGAGPPGVTPGAFLCGGGGGVFGAFWGLNLCCGGGCVKKTEKGGAGRRLANAGN